MWKNGLHFFSIFHYSVRSAFDPILFQISTVKPASFLLAVHLFLLADSLCFRLPLGSCLRMWSKHLHLFTSLFLLPIPTLSSTSLFVYGLAIVSSIFSLNIWFGKRLVCCCLPCPLFRFRIQTPSNHSLYQCLKYVCKLQKNSCHEAGPSDTNGS